jgi:plastocyanin
MRLFRLFLAAGAFLLAVIAVPEAEAANRQVFIRAVDGPTGRFEAAPGSSGATINQGDTVFWLNQDGDTHNATGNGWSTGNIAPGDEGSETFNTPGDFPYSCAIHPSMTGTLRVNAVATTQGTAPPVTATPMQPPPAARPTATTRRSTATTRRSTSATTASGVPTTIAGDFSVLAPTTTELSTTSTSGQVAIREDDDGGGSNTGVIAALAVGLAAILGGGAYALARLRGTP